MRLILAAAFLALFGGTVLADTTAVSVGEVVLTGTSKSETFDSAAFAGGLGNGTTTAIFGTFKNAHPRGVTMTDLTVTVKKKGTIGSNVQADELVVNAGAPQPTSNVDGGESATVNGLNIGGNGTGNFKITGINAAGTSELTITLTPSYNIPFGETAREANAIRLFAFEQSTDLMRHGLEETWHDVIFTYITNEDGRFDLTELNGNVQLPYGSGVSLVSVHVQDPSNGYSDVAGVTALVSGNSFSVTNLALEPNDSVRLVLVLSDDLQGGTLQVELEARY